MNARRIAIVVLVIIIIGLGAYQLIGNQIIPRITGISVRQQLAEISAAQKRIEQKLVAVEATQKNIVKSLSNLQGGRQAAAAQRRPTPDLNKVYKIDIGDSPIRGNKNAKVTIIEYSEVQCPYSQRFHPILLEVLKAYPNDVRLVFKHFPLNFHKDAKPAAKAILTAGEQGKYWEMLDLLFVNGRNLSDERYPEFAKQLGLDAGRFTKDLKEKDSKWEDIINKDMELGRTINVRGTPTCFMNGKRTQARDLASFKREIGAILKK